MNQEKIKILLLNFKIQALIPIPLGIFSAFLAISFLKYNSVKLKYKTNTNVCIKSSDFHTRTFNSAFTKL